ncbi:hypothetical protein F4604DRAFT_1918771 [Suillus subluteus]|nr:hypothetical protein F4604DRAFT_1918771 [Suillus subluteus]
MADKKSPLIYDAQVSNQIYEQLYDYICRQHNQPCLADALYEKDFRRETDNRGNIYFTNNHTNQDYEILLLAEIALFVCGTKLQAIGSHWLGRQGEPNYVEDNTPIKCPLACTMGYQAPQLVNNCWYNTITEINNIIETEKERDEKKWRDCLGHATSDNTDPDVIMVHTQRLYDVPQDQCKHRKATGKTSRMQKMTLEPVASTSTSAKTAVKGDTV